MQIPVLIEPVDAKGFRAPTGEPLLLTAEGATREEALDKLQQLLMNRLKNGTEMVTLYVGPNGNTCLPPDHPLAPFAGRYAPNDPIIEEWKEAVEEYRKQKDEEVGIEYDPLRP